MALSNVRTGHYRVFVYCLFLVRVSYSGHDLFSVVYKIECNVTYKCTESYFL